MEFGTVKVERLGRTALVTFDRGNGVNALSQDLMEELIGVAGSFEDDTDINTIILTGAKNAFTGGIDLKDPKLLQAMNADLGARRKLLAYGPKMCRAWEDLEQITIAAIEGHCVGGGVALAISCDFRIAARSAFFRIPELKLGMNMSWQSLPRLTHLVGPARAKEMVILAQKVNASTAHDWGLVQEVTEDGKAVGHALEMADKIATMPPLPVRMTKETINAITNSLDRVCSHMDTDQFMLCQMTEDHKEAIGAFLNKRDPEFKGR
jgi:enoyl-CoA hydratase/carnithine racemase